MEKAEPRPPLNTHAIIFKLPVPSEKFAHMLIGRLLEAFELNGFDTAMDNEGAVVLFKLKPYHHRAAIEVVRIERGSL